MIKITTTVDRRYIRSAARGRLHISLLVSFLLGACQVLVLAADFLDDGTVNPVTLTAIILVFTLLCIASSVVRVREQDAQYRRMRELWGTNINEQTAEIGSVLTLTADQSDAVHQFFPTDILRCTEDRYYFVIALRSGLSICLDKSRIEGGTPAQIRKALWLERIRRFRVGNS